MDVGNGSRVGNIGYPFVANNLVAITLVLE
jgi:hypothetical protein